MRDPQPDDPLLDATLAVLEMRVPETARRMLDQIAAEVAECAAITGPAFWDAGLAHCTDHVRAWLTAARERRELGAGELRFVRDHAVMRARQGVDLELLLRADRAGRRAIFHALVDAAGHTADGLAVALLIHDRTLVHGDQSVAMFTEAYVRTRHEMNAGSDAARRRLLDQALAGGVQPGERGEDHARALGIDPSAAYVVVACAPASEAAVTPTALQALAVRLEDLDAPPGRGGLAVVRDDEVVGVLRLGDRAPSGLGELVESALGASGVSAGMSLPCRGIGELPRGYHEARAVLRRADPGRALWLMELTAFEYLTLTADETAHRLVDPQVRSALEDDAAAGGTLARTLMAFLDADMSAPAAAEGLSVHANTVYYRLDKLRRTTGRNPRRFHDLVELLAAVRIVTDGGRLRRANPVPGSG